MKRMGSEGIYLGGGGWATLPRLVSETRGPTWRAIVSSADGHAAWFRAMMTADHTSSPCGCGCSDGNRRTDAAVDYRPFLIATRQPARRGFRTCATWSNGSFEAGRAGYHIEGPAAGAPRNVATRAARFGGRRRKIKAPPNPPAFKAPSSRLPGSSSRAPTPRTPTVDSRADRKGRDQPFVLGTRTQDPSYTSASWRWCGASTRRASRANGKERRKKKTHRKKPDPAPPPPPPPPPHMPAGEYAVAIAWLASRHCGLVTQAPRPRTKHSSPSTSSTRGVEVVDAWQNDAGLMTYSEAVAELLESQRAKGE